MSYHMCPYRQHPMFYGGDWFDSAMTPARIFDQNFGIGLDEALRLPYWARGPRLGNGEESGTSEVVSDKNRFAVNLDVKHFTPEEIKVKTVENSLIVEGKHEERMDEHGFVSRSFKRRYVLPKDVDMAALKSNLSREGVLSIEAPKKHVDAPNERTIPVQLGNRPAAIEQHPKK